jgi:hypothetical protein
MLITVYIGLTICNGPRLRCVCGHRAQLAAGAPSHQSNSSLQKAARYVHSTYRTHLQCACGHRAQLAAGAPSHHSNHSFQKAARYGTQYLPSATALCLRASGPTCCWRAQPPLKFQSSTGRQIWYTVLTGLNCVVSAGIGPNLLLARLATKQAKPNGQALIRPDQARQVNYIYGYLSVQPTSASCD